jgi:hypothetical protein
MPRLRLQRAWLWRSSSTLADGIGRSGRMDVTTTVTTPRTCHSHRWLGSVFRFLIRLRRRPIELSDEAFLTAISDMELAMSAAWHMRLRRVIVGHGCPERAPCAQDHWVGTAG